MLNIGLRLVASCMLAIMVTGCALTHTVNTGILPRPEAEAMIRPWPLSIGLYVPQSVSARELAGQAWRMPVGTAIEANFRWAIGRMFSKVVVLTRPPEPSIMQDGLAGVIELADVAYKQGLPGSLGYEIRLYSDRGIRLDAWTVTTSLPLWDVEASSFSGSMQTVGTEFAHALRNVTARFMVQFAERPAVRTWLVDHGTEPAMQVFFAGGGPSAARTRILLIPNLDSWLYTDARSAMACLGDRLAAASPPYEVVPADRLRLEFYPWLEPVTAPKSLEDLRRWLAEAAVRDKMAALGVRYLLEFHGGTKTEMPGGGVLCGAGYGGGGCLGFAWGSRESSFGATLLDLSAGTSFDAVSSQRSGVYLPAFLVPIPIMAPTEAMACDELARQLHARFGADGL